MGGAAAFVLALRWLLREEPETVFRQALAPGEGLTVRVRAADGDGEAGVGGH